MLGVLLQLTGETLRRPQVAARMMMGYKVERHILWMALGLVAVLTTLFVKATMFAMPTELAAGNSALPKDPFVLTLVLAGLLVASAFFTHFAGRAFGGKGVLDDSIKTTIWMQAVLLVLQVVQIVLFMVSPILALFFGWIGMIYVAYIFLKFVQLLHGFKSMPMVFLGAVAAFFGLMLGISLVISLIASVFGLELVPNV